MYINKPHEIERGGGALIQIINKDFLVGQYESILHVTLYTPLSLFRKMQFRDIHTGFDTSLCTNSFKPFQLI